ncbi:MAG: CheR family methyltransferase [Erythrobacter sp.]
MMEPSPAALQIIADLLTLHTGQQLTENRRWRVSSALAALFREHGINNVDQLVCLLDQPTGTPLPFNLEREVVEALLNNETYFFRDKPTFDQLPEYILPELARRRAGSRRLSIWSAGCSTGQEVYSLAMLFAEQPARWEGWTIDILGTDVSHRAIAAARSGRYSQFEVQRGLGVGRMLQHFEECPKGWQIRSKAKRFARFQQHNILSLPPSRQPFDLILCRNVLLYFNQQTRTHTFGRLAEALAPDGFLMLGAGETTAAQTDQFVACDHRISLFQPQSAASRLNLARAV